MKHLPSPTRTTVITAPLAGLLNQARGLAERAGLDPVVLSLAPRAPWGRIAPRLWSDPVRVVGGLESVDGGLVVGAGGMAGAVGAALRRRRGLAVVQVQNPRVPLRGFSFVVVNRHDEVTGPNVFVARTAMHRVSPAVLADARAHWGPKLTGGGRLVAVLLGGSNGRYRLDAAVGAALARDLARLARAELGLRITVTPSRRTDPAVTDLLRAALAPLGGTVWDGTGENPYHGMLALADAIVVTGDSVSMISEAAATTAPVFVVPLPGRSRRIGLFTAELVRAGRVRPFAGTLASFPVQPLDDTAEAAQEMCRRLGLGG